MARGDRHTSRPKAPAGAAQKSGRKPRAAARPSAPGTPHEPQGEHGAWLVLPRLLTLTEAADYLRISRGALYARIQRGTFPGLVKIGRRYRVDSARLLQWVDQSRVGDTPKGQ